MKKLSIIFVIIFIYFISYTPSKAYICYQLGCCWEITGGFEVQGKVENGTIHGNTNDIETMTEVYVYCQGSGYCMRVYGEGYLEFDMGVENVNFIPKEQIPVPSGPGIKTAAKE